MLKPTVSYLFGSADGVGAGTRALGAAEDAGVLVAARVAEVGAAALAGAGKMVARIVAAAPIVVLKTENVLITLSNCVPDYFLTLINVAEARVYSRELPRHLLSEMRSRT